MSVPTCGARQDMMLGLEPGDEELTFVALHEAEAQEGMHLVEIAADSFGHPPQPMCRGNDAQGAASAPPAPAAPSCNPPSG
jgi:hypothetical protein